MAEADDGLSRARSCSENTVIDFFKQFHLYDYIVAPYSRENVKWKTSPRKFKSAIELYEAWKDQTSLIGVRFPSGRPESGKGMTSYLLLDIDKGSPYHPHDNQGRCDELIHCLEDIGLCRYLVVQSSASTGIHVYFPLPERLSCFRIALTVQQALKSNGFMVNDGQLEIFPNVKVPNMSYKAHRLPLQKDSYALDSHYDPIPCSLEQWIQLWDLAARNQDIELFRETVNNIKFPKNKGSSCKRAVNSPPVALWKESLEDSFREGWTGKGQTNNLLKDICIYGRVFEGKEFNELEEWAIEFAKSLPGYETFCRHRHEIEQRVRDWVRSNHRSNRYYPLGSRQREGQKKEGSGPNNEERAKSALQRIEHVVMTLKTEGRLSAKTVRKRTQLICQMARCSTTTLNKYPQLWHPQYCLDENVEST